MANDNQNPMVAFIEAKIAAWQAALTTLKAALAIDSGGSVEGVDLSAIPTQSGNGEIGQPYDLPAGVFNGKSIPACIKLYLGAVKKKKTVKEIATALREGGVESNADNFESPVTTALNRLKAAGDVLRFKDGWGLSEWYPANIRGAAPAAASSKRSRKLKRTARKSTPKVLAGTATSIQSSPLAKTGKTSDRIIGILKSKPDHNFSIKEVAENIGTSFQIANLVLGQLRKKGTVKMTAPGMYAIARPMLAASGD